MLRAGAILSPIAGELVSSVGLAPWLAEAPALSGLALVGVVANVSAVRRLCMVGRHAAARSPARAPAGVTPVVPAATLEANATGPAPGL